MQENERIVCIEPGSFQFEKTFIQDRPENGYVRVKIEHIGICGTDYHAFRGEQTFFTYPRVLGHELAGKAVDINLKNKHSDISVNDGDNVTIIPYFHCGKCSACRIGKTNCCVEMQVLGVHIDGGMCKYLDVPIEYIISCNELSSELLALIEPLSIAQHAIYRTAINKTDTVLVIGAGPIGLGIVFLLKHYGIKPLVMDIDVERLRFIEGLLNVEVILKKKGAYESLNSKTNELPTVVMDATGNIHSMNETIELLTHGGKLVFIGHNKETIQIPDPDFHKKEATLIASRNAKREDFLSVIEILKKTDIDAHNIITQNLNFRTFNDDFRKLLKSNELLIKAVIDVD